MQYKFNMEGTCTKQVSFEIDENNKIRKTFFLGGCNGNSKGIAALAEGRTPDEIIPLLQGIRCSFKNTSCPDQFSKALQKAIDCNNN
ncbi:MAG: TIGR03905 family protein [Clostridiales bacterium GWF2_38_85]|nr:MAG: TIGR03905 family protein [Clostridiales bacterium GWF2_38_85]HBL84950.1 TIGR03905 family TSCPD domain-containing protein [Clostridiales bacterium]